MRKLIMILMITIACLNANSQCNCQILNKDGHDVKQCAISPMAGDNLLQIGMGVGKLESITYVSLSIRFKYSAQKIHGNLQLTLASGKMIQIKLLNSGLAYIGNSEVCQATFILSSTNKVLLKQSAVKTVAFYLQDDLKHVLSVTMNPDIIKSQLTCL